MAVPKLGLGRALSSPAESFMISSWTVLVALDGRFEPKTCGRPGGLHPKGAA